MDSTSWDNLRHLPLKRRWREQERPVAGVLMLIHRTQDESESPSEKGQYLLIQRKQAPFAGKWALVGGKIEFGETIATAATREVLEETGLTSQFVALRAIVNERLTPDDKKGHGGHWLLFVCEVSVSDGEVREQDEGPLAWFTQPELKKLNSRGEVIPSDYEMIARFAGSDHVVPYVESVVQAQPDNPQEVSLVLFDLTRAG